MKRYRAQTLLLIVVAATGLLAGCHEDSQVVGKVGCMAFQPDNTHVRVTSESQRFPSGTTFKCGEDTRQPEPGSGAAHSY
jgi:hypothetical protein